MNDHLGNTRVVVSDSGKVLQRSDYYAFGLQIPHLPITSDSLRLVNKYLYNGKELQPQTGLLDYGASQYNAGVGRWFGVDPLSEISRRFSPFTYGFDNPINVIDPDGMAGRKIKDLQGNEYEIGEEALVNVYTDGGEDPPSKKTKEPPYLYNEKGEKVYRDGRPYYDLNNIPTIFEMDTRTEEDPTRLIDDFLAFFSPYKALEGLLLLAKLNPLRKGQAVSHLITAIAKKFKNFQCMDCADEIIKALKKQGIKGEILDVIAPKNDNIYSDTFKGNISTNGRHRAILVNGKVYDNINPNGIDNKNWVNDLVSPNGFKVTSTPF